MAMTLFRKINGAVFRSNKYNDTNYIPESEIEDYRFMTTGQYGGIGALIHQKGDFVVVTDPYEGYPAQKADLRAGDEILEIDGKSTKGKRTDEVSKILKGQPKTQ